MAALPHRMVAHHGQHEIEIRKSRFICSLYRVTSEDEARTQIEAARKMFWDATHNCTAWIIGERQRLQRSSDDGEPSGTAGMPMLEVLRRRGVTDTLAIVTRYFGGVLLGAGGLIRAYGGVVSDALDDIGIVERKPLQVVGITASYDDAGRLEHTLRASEWRLEDVDYGTDVTFTVILEPSQAAAFSTWVQERTNGALAPVALGERWVEVPAPSHLEGVTAND